jgi:ATP-dependent Clp protease ATP-binding subunit ClpA
LLTLLKEVRVLIDGGMSGASAIAIVVERLAPALLSTHVERVPATGPEQIAKDVQTLDLVLSELSMLENKKHLDIEDFVRSCRKNSLWPEGLETVHGTIDKDTVFTRCLHAMDSDFVVSKIGRNITLQALEGTLDPVCGRKDIISEVAQTLVRRNKANPVLVGDAGVGKTAIVEGLAQALINGEIRGELSGAVIYEISPAQLFMRAENPAATAALIQRLIAECASIPWIVLFVDEIHTIFGGRNNYTTDITNIMKPALARHDVRLIGATTPSEYTNTIETDHALERRVQRINVSEMNHEDTVKLTEFVLPRYETYHQVRVPKDIVPKLVTLSSFYNPQHRQPDAVITFVDTLMAHCRIFNKSEVDTSTLSSVLARNESPFLVSMVDAGQTSLATTKETMQTILPSGATVTDSIIRQGLNAAYRKPLASILLTTIKGGIPLIYATELSQALYNKDNVIYYDLQEFFDPATIQRWLGSPAGYIGFDRGGMLVTQINARNNAVLVLDNLDQAHQSVLNIIENMIVNGYVTLGRTAYLNSTIVVAAVRGIGPTNQLGFTTGAEKIIPKKKSPLVCFGDECVWPIDTMETILAYAKHKFPKVAEDEVRRVATLHSFDISAVAARLKGMQR